MKKIIVTVIVSILIFICGCSPSKSQKLPPKTTLAVETEISLGPTFTNTITPEPTYANITTTLTPTVISSSAAKFVNTPITKIYVTQIPVEISDISKGNNEYLYHNVKVTLIVDTSNDRAFSYINLDDLSNNNMANSDIELIATQGKSNFYNKSYFLHPANYATFYFSGESIMDYDSCFAHLSEFQDFPAGWFPTGRPICVLTNEERIAVINYVLGSEMENEKDHLASIIFNVTVYNQIVK